MMPRGLIPVLAVACGSSGSGSAMVNGAVDGQPVMVADVIGLVGTKTGSSPSAYAGIAIAGASGACSRAQQGKLWDPPPGTGVFVLDVIAPGAAVGPGTYSVGGTGVAQYTSMSADGKSTNGYAGDGTVTFESVGDTLVGSFDVSLAKQGRFTGRFMAPVCRGGADPF